MLAMSFALTVSAASILFPYQGGTGTGVVPTVGQVLIGQSNGTYLPQSTSSLGIGGITNAYASSTFPSFTYASSTYVSSSSFPSILASNTTHTFTVGGNIATSTVNGVIATSTIITTAIASSSTNFFNVLVNGVASSIATIINSFTQSVTGNTLTSTINGISATTPVITSNTLAIAGGIATSTVNGVVATSTVPASGGSTFSTTSINGFATTSFSFATTSTGTDFSISTSTTQVLFNLPTASASNRGALSSADWTTFNSKQPAGSYALTSRLLNTTYPIQGGGDLTADRTFSLAFGTTTSNTWSQVQTFTSGFVNSATSTGAFGFNISAGCFAIGGNCLSLGTIGGTVGIANGGTATTTQVTNGVNFFDGTKITSGTALTFNGTNLNLGAPSATYQINGVNVVNASTTLYNYFFGGAGNLTMTGNFNTANGYQSLYSNTTGYSNVANGYQSLYSNTTGYSNVANGNNSLTFNTTGSNNTANGTLALFSNTTGNSNTANGYQSLYSNTTGNYNTANGVYALLNNTSATNTVAVGAFAGYGSGGAYSNQGGSTVGYQSGYNFQTGSDYNTLFGYQSGYGVTTGARNVLLGQSTIAASQNQVTTGSNNIAIGNDVAVPTATASNQLDIGNFIYGTGLSGTGATLSTALLGIGTSTPSQTLTIAGSEYLTKGFYDSTNATGTLGQILSSTGTSTQWITGITISRIIVSTTTNTIAGSNATTDYVYLVSSSTTITLPTAVGNTNRYSIKRTGTSTVIINTTSAQTIDGSATAPLNTQYQSVDFISDNSNWNII